MGGGLQVKAILTNKRGDQEIRRFGMKESASLTTCTALRDKVKVTFPSLEHKSFKLHWEDEDCDHILFTTDEELQRAFKDDRFLERDTLTIYIRVLKSNPKSVHQDAPDDHADTAQNILHPVEPMSTATTPILFPALPESAENADQDAPHACVDSARVARVWCDGCQCQILWGTWFKCQVCADFDLCGRCHDGGYHDKHPFIELAVPPTYPYDEVEESFDEGGSNRRAAEGANGTNITDFLNAHGFGTEEAFSEHPVGGIAPYGQTSDQQGGGGGGPLRGAFASAQAGGSYGPRFYPYTARGTTERRSGPTPPTCPDEGSSTSAERHHQNNVNRLVPAGVSTLVDMGYTDHGGVLTRLVRAHDGNIKEVHEAIDGVNRVLGAFSPGLTVKDVHLAVNAKALVEEAKMEEDKKKAAASKDAKDVAPAKDGCSIM